MSSWFMHYAVCRTDRAAPNLLMIPPWTKGGGVAGRQGRRQSWWRRRTAWRGSWNLWETRCPQSNLVFGGHWRQYSFDCCRIAYVSYNWMWFGCDDPNDFVIFTLLKRWICPQVYCFTSRKEFCLGILNLFYENKIYTTVVIVLLLILFTYHSSLI